MFAIPNDDGISSEKRESRGWPILLPAALLPFFGSFLYFVILRGTSASQLVYGGVKVFTLVYPLLVCLALERRSLSWRPGDWEKHALSIPIGLITGLFMVLAMAVVFAFTPLGEMLAATRPEANWNRT